ncbi:MAG: 5'/3'-nucleotidase SurE [Acidobacteriota bacterium]
MRILVTNDDGIFSEGIHALADAAAAIGSDVTVVAPDREQSATSHSLTLHRPLRVRKVRPGWYSVDGTPTDCVNMALNGLLKDARPDLVVSGINLGPNLGDDVTYSGTVSATFEANLYGIPAVAFSLDVDRDVSFTRAGLIAQRVIAQFIDTLLDAEPPARDDEGRAHRDLLLNVNLPPGVPKGFRFTTLSRRYYQQNVVEKRDPRGRRYYWIAGTPAWDAPEGTDQHAVLEGYVSLTPLHLDLTDHGGKARYAPLRTRLDAVGLPDDLPAAPDDENGADAADKTADADT